MVYKRISKYIEDSQKRIESNIANIMKNYTYNSEDLIKHISIDLNISEEEATKLLEVYHEKVPFVRGIADEAMTQAQKKGVIRTWLGRKCRFEMYEPKSFGFNKALPWKEALEEYGGKGMIRRAFTYKALNKLIQGSSADQTKKAMVDCYNEGLIPMLTVHDELCFNIESEEQVTRVVEIMETCVKDLNIPFKVDAEMGKNWGEVG